MIGTALRRTGSGFSPLSLSPKFWIDASDTSTLTLDGSNRVNTWADKSTNALSFGKVDSTGPTSNSVTKNGLNTLTWPSTGNRRLSVSGQTYWGDGTALLVALVIRCSTTIGFRSFAPLSGQRIGLKLRNPSFECYMPGAVGASGLAIRQRYGTGSSSWAVDNLSSTSYSTTAWHILTFIVDPTNGTAGNRSFSYVDGGSAIQNNVSTNALSGTPQSAVFVGGDNWPDQGMYYDDCLAEAICVAGANATEANRQSLRDYLNTKWAIY